MKFNFLIIAAAAAIIGITLLFIWRRHTLESRGEAIDKYIANEENQAILEDEAERMKMYDDIIPLTGYRNPDVERQYMNLPFRIYYYNEDRLDERTKQLLFGTGTAPVYRRNNPLKYPMYQANVYETQLYHNVPPPDRYDYLSFWDTQSVG